MPSETLSRPLAQEHNPYFSTYIDRVPDGDLLGLLTRQADELTGLTRGLADEVAGRVHPPYAWTLKQVLSHCLDTERIMGCRMARVAAGDETALPGFDQDLYVANTDLGGVSLDELVDEFNALRDSHIRMIRRWSPAMAARSGAADGHPFSARAGAWILAGHLAHHLEIIRQRLAGDPEAARTV